MDQVLRARKLGSATARRRKIQERDTLTQQDEERRFQLLLYGYSSDEELSSDDDGGATYSPITDPQADHHRSTSQLSTLSNAALVKSPSGPSPSVPLPSQLPCKPRILDTVVSQSLSPGLDACHIAPGPFVEEDEFEAPAQVATCILYSTPRGRPSMVLIRIPTSKSNMQPPNRPSSLPHPPPIPARSENRVSALTVEPNLSPTRSPLYSNYSLQREAETDANDWEEKNVVCGRPSTMSVKSESTLQHQLPSYDVFPRRSKTASSSMSVPPIACPGPQSPASSLPQIIVTRRISSFPPAPQDPVLHGAVSPPRELHNKKSASTPRSRRSSIGLALRHAQSSLKGKTVTSQTTAPGSFGLAQSKDGMDFSAFPMPPPLPPPPPPLLLQHSFHPPPRGPPNLSSDGSSSRLRRVRTTMGL